MNWKKVAIGVGAVFVLIQFIPYGKDHTNPPVVAEPNWVDEWTRETFMRACGDCHSHNTKWPWYSNIAPISWLVYHDVKEGREHCNVSMWGHQKENECDDAAKEVKKGEMPPLAYLLMHPEARLSKDEKQRFIAGLIKTFGDEEEEDE